MLISKSSIPHRSLRNSTKDQANADVIRAERQFERDGLVIGAWNGCSWTLFLAGTSHGRAVALCSKGANLVRPPMLISSGTNQVSTFFFRAFSKSEVNRNGML